LLLQNVYFEKKNVIGLSNINFCVSATVRLPTSDGSASKGKQQTSEPVHILKRSFARTVSVECFESLLSILHWSWTTLVLGVEELRGLKGFQFTATLLDLERLRFVGTCCLRLLRVYTCEIYPVSGMKHVVGPELQ